MNLLLLILIVVKTGYGHNVMIAGVIGIECQGLLCGKLGVVHLERVVFGTEETAACGPLVGQD